MLRWTPGLLLFKRDIFKSQGNVKSLCWNGTSGSSGHHRHVIHGKSREYAAHSVTLLINQLRKAWITSGSSPPYDWLIVSITVTKIQKYVGKIHWFFFRWSHTVGNLERSQVTTLFALWEISRSHNINGVSIWTVARPEHIWKKTIKLWPY